MKIELKKDGLLIVPETDFEEQTLKNMFSGENKPMAFLKCGLTPKEVIGLRILSLIEES